MELQKNPQHIVWLDVVRFVAMFTVVCCHCTDPFNFYPGNFLCQSAAYLHFSGKNKEKTDSIVQNKGRRL